MHHTWKGLYLKFRKAGGEYHHHRGHNHHHHYRHFFASALRGLPLVSESEANPDNNLMMRRASSNVLFQNIILDAPKQWPVWIERTFAYVLYLKMFSCQA